MDSANASSRINRFFTISKRTASAVREEGETLDSSSPPSRNSGIVTRGNPLNKTKSESNKRAHRTANSIAKGIEQGRQESSETIKALQKSIEEKQAEIELFTELLASREVDQAKSTATIKSLTEDNARLQAEREKLCKRLIAGAGAVVDTVAGLSVQLAERTKELAGRQQRLLL